MKPSKILFFIDGGSPTIEEVAEADAMGAQVCFRNAQHIPAEGALEACDGVTGCVPARYAEAYPTAEVAIAARKKALADLAAKVADEAPPKVEEAAKEPASEPAKASGDPDADAKAPAATAAKPAGWAANK